MTGYVRQYLLVQPPSEGVILLKNGLVQPSQGAVPYPDQLKSESNTYQNDIAQCRGLKLSLLMSRTRTSISPCQTQTSAARIDPCCGGLGLASSTMIPLAVISNWYVLL